MAVRTASYAAYHDSAGTATNPTTASVLADTGAMAAGLYEAKVFVGCSVAAIFTVQHRNVANDGNVSDPVLLRAAAGQTGEYVIKYSVNLNERVRILPAASITGDAEASVNVERIA